MKEQFLNYEQSLALKELGFDVPCLGAYTYNADEFYWELRFTINTNYHSHIVSAPLFQQAFEFFREKYNLHTQDFIDLDNKFTKNIVKISKEGQEFIHLNYHTFYNEAQTECINKLIEIANEK